MKQKLLDYLHSFTNFDLIYLAAVIVIFFLLLLLTLLLRKRLTFALLILLFALLELILGTTIGFGLFHNYLYKNTITVTQAKKLHFLQAVLIEGIIKNDSKKFDFSQCDITATITKETHNKYKNLIFKLKPIKTKTIQIDNIPRGQTKKFKFLIEPFLYKKDINITVSGVCQ